MANRYLRPNGGSYGAEDGSDWTNAYNGFSDIPWASITAGDTLWIAGGTYSQNLTPTKTGTSGAPIALRRARMDSSECTTADGWQDSFASTITSTGNIVFGSNYSYITFSGRTTSSGGSYGWTHRHTAATAPGVNFTGSGSNYNVFEYMVLRGPGTDVSYGSGNEGRAFDITGSGNNTGNRYSHLTIYDWAEGVVDVGSSAQIFEWIEMYDIHNPAYATGAHPNGIITWGAPNGIVRYCIFRKGPAGYGCGEGVFFEQAGGSTAWKIYGNIFANLDESGWKAIEITSQVGAIKVFNNTFVNILYGSLYTSDSPGATGGEWRNNLNYLSDNETIGTASNNMVASTSAVFTDYAGGDYHIKSNVETGYPRDKGIALDAEYASDRDGNTRGADGTWDIGAYEYSEGTPPSGTITLSVR